MTKFRQDMWLLRFISRANSDPIGIRFFGPAQQAYSEFHCVHKRPNGLLGFDLWGEQRCLSSAGYCIN